MTINKIKVQGTDYEIVPSKIEKLDGSAITIPANAQFTDTDTQYKFILNGTTNGSSNGTSLGTAYAPTSAGNAGQVLVSGGNNSAPTWSNIGDFGSAGSLYSFTLNGTLNGDTSGISLGSAYAPTTVGTLGQVLTSSGNGAPTWTTLNITDTNTTYKFTLNGLTLGDATRGQNLGNVYGPTEPGTAGQILVSTGDDLTPVWADADTIVTGGGSGGYAPTTPGTQGQILISSGDGAPVWTSIDSILPNYNINSKFADLGLSVKWAKGNLKRVGEEAYVIGDPHEPGSYFSWGDLVGHLGSGYTDEYSFTSANYSNKVSGNGKELTASIPTGDVDHDAAARWLGTPYRIPTAEEILELFDTKGDTANYTWEWTTTTKENDLITSYGGWTITYKTTGDSIYLPMCGYHKIESGEDIIYNNGMNAYLTSVSYSAMRVFFMTSSNLAGNSGGGVFYGDRYCGYNIRPVYGAEESNEG